MKLSFPSVRSLDPAVKSRPKKHQACSSILFRKWIRKFNITHLVKLKDQNACIVSIQYHNHAVDMLGFFTSVLLNDILNFSDYKVSRRLYIFSNKPCGRHMIRAAGNFQCLTSFTPQTVRSFGRKKPMQWHKFSKSLFVWITFQ